MIARVIALAAFVACLFWPSAASAVSFIAAIQGTSPTQVISPSDAACTATGGVTTPTGSVANYHNLSGPCAQNGFTPANNKTATVATSTAGLGYIKSNLTTDPTTDFAALFSGALSTTTSIGNPSLVSKDYPEGGGHAGFDFHLNGTASQIECDVGSTALQASIVLDTKFHIWICNLSGGTLAIYQDGVFLASAPATYAASAAQGITYGDNIVTTGNPFIGLESVSAIWLASSLTITQVLTIYNASGLGYIPTRLYPRTGFPQHFRPAYAPRGDPLFEALLPMKAA